MTVFSCVFKILCELHRRVLSPFCSRFLFAFKQFFSLHKAPEISVSYKYSLKTLDFLLWVKRNLGQYSDEIESTDRASSWPCPTHNSTARKRERERNQLDNQFVRSLLVSSGSIDITQQWVFSPENHVRGSVLWDKINVILWLCCQGLQLGCNSSLFTVWPFDMTWVQLRDCTSWSEAILKLFSLSREELVIEAVQEARQTKKETRWHKTRAVS